MKKLLLVTASIVALGAAAPALAVDLAAQPVYTKAPPVANAIYDWSGFYVGINGGGWGFSDPTGDTVGGQIGYRQQMGQLVFGLEGQGNWADLSGSNVSAAFQTINSAKTDAFGLITGQIGYAVNNVLLYAKGGAAVTSTTFQVNNALTGAQLASTDSTRWGGAVGAGIEVGFAPNWSLGFEYDHLFMQNGDVSFGTTAGAVATDRIRQDFDLVTARLNYKFSPVLLKY